MTSKTRSDMNGSVPRQSTPTHSMVLRSACRVCGCTAGKDIPDGRSPRHKHGHKHGHHIHSSTNHWHSFTTPTVKSSKEEHTKENSTLNANFESNNIYSQNKSSSLHYESRNKLVKVPLISDEFAPKENHSSVSVVTTEVKTVESVEETQINSLQLTRRHLFSDYSSGNDTSDSQNEAESKQSHERLTMSRTRIYGQSGISGRAMLPSDSESEDENPIPSVNTRTAERHNQSRNRSTSQASTVSQWNIKQNSTVIATSSHPSQSLNSSHLGNSHYIRQTEDFDVEYSDIDESDTHFIDQSRSSFSYLTLFTTIMSFTLVEKVLQCFSWLMWKTIYRPICTILLIDTWILSRCNSFGKRKCFLLLVIPFLLWMCGYSGFLQDDIKTVASSPVNFLSSAMSLLSASTLAFFSSKQNDNAVLKSNLPSEEIAHDSSSKTLKYSAELYNDKDSEYIKKLVQSVFKQELSEIITKFAKHQEFLSTKQTTELSQQSKRLEDLQMQLNSVLVQSQHLSEELLQVKEQLLSQLKRNDLERESVTKAKDAGILEDKLEEVENRIYSLQHLIEAMKNCCTNYSNYASVTESHFADLLMEAVEGDVKGRKSPLADFGSWLQRNFISENTLSERMNVMENHIKSDVSVSVKQQAEDTAKSAVAESIDLLKEEVTEKTNTLAGFYATSFSNSHHCPTEDTVKKIIKDAISIYDADKTGLVDYALESAGGSIINTRCSETYQASTGLISMFGIPLWYITTSPRTVIQPGCYPGQCWSFKGSQGYLVIALSATIIPKAFTMEHIPKSLSPTGSIDSAPKDFSVWGLTKENDLDGTLLGWFEYKKDGDSLQHFTVQNPDPGYFSIVELRIHSNHGNFEFTCLYRFRVHGTT